MKYLYTIFLLFIQISLFSQFYTGTLSEDYQLQLEKIDNPLAIPRSSPLVFNQLDGFPLAFPSDPNTPNLRNITLEDINNDGIQDLLFCANNILYAYSNNTQLWAKAMTGTGIYPPSVADIDDDGDVEIIQVTGGNRKRGRVYAFDHLGNNLSGFPKNYDDNWIITSAAIADLDNDGQMEIIFSELNPPNGSIHILNNKGERWSDDWPLRIPGNPAVTPSIGDIDNDGQKEIVMASTKSLYAFDLAGQLKDGWPVENPDTKFSFQSPILVDLDGDDDLEIVGATHGIVPEFYVYHHDGTAYNAWPFFVPERTTTFVSPTVIEGANGYEIIMSRPSTDGSVLKDRLYKWDADGNLAAGFPFETDIGTNGVISVANIDEDADMELIFSSNIFHEDGTGFIHAINMDGSGEVAGFPIRTKGYTLMNGAAIGDVNGDGLMDLSALSYTPNFDTQPDSVFISVYDLGTTYRPEKILWTTYKGSNTRDGNLDKSMVSNIFSPQIKGITVEILPNPIYEKGSLRMELSSEKNLTGNLISINGQFSQILFQNTFTKGSYNFDFPALVSGTYFLVLKDAKNRAITKKIIVQNK